MTDSSNMQDIAQRYLELWQKQLDAMMHDPDITGRMLKTLYDLQRIYYPQSLAPEEEQSSDDGYSATDESISQHGDAALLELEQRIRACEARIASLEARVKEGGGNAPQEPGSSKPAAGRRWDILEPTD